MKLKSVWRVLKGAAENWSNDNVPRMGAALSFYTIFAISPLFIIVVFVASLFFNNASVQRDLFEQVSGLVGKQGAATLQSNLAASTPHRQGVVASTVAIVTLVLSATGLFVELQNDLNKIFGVRVKPGQGVWAFVKNRLLSFAMVVGIGFLLLVSLIISTALSAAAHYFSALVPGLGVLGHVANLVVSFAVIAVLFTMFFKVLPDVRIGWQETWLGGAITALLFTAGKFLLGMYLGRSSTVSMYGAAGSLVLILLWVYYSAQILFFGAELTRAYANQCGTRLVPKAYAELSAPAPRGEALPPGSRSPSRPPSLSRREELVAELRQGVEGMKEARRGVRG
jgi:membrane protein